MLLGHRVASHSFGAKLRDLRKTPLSVIMSQMGCKTIIKKRGFESGNSGMLSSPDGINSCGNVNKD